MNKLVPMEGIENKIHVIRGQKAMLDFDLAALYMVSTRNLKRQVRRNLGRFPQDFMFETTNEEYRSLRCQFGTLEKGKYTKYLPYAFTEHGVAMLSSVLNSERAIQVNISIMRAFTKIRKFMLAHKEFAYKLRELETKFNKNDLEIGVLFKILRRMVEMPVKKGRKIGFMTDKGN